MPWLPIPVLLIAVSKQGQALPPMTKTIASRGSQCSSLVMKKKRTHHYKSAGTAKFNGTSLQHQEVTGSLIEGCVLSTLLFVWEF